jgi:hypothetical protein
MPCMKIPHWQHLPGVVVLGEKGWRRTKEKRKETEGHLGNSPTIQDTQAHLYKHPSAFLDLLGRTRGYNPRRRRTAV